MENVRELSASLAYMARWADTLEGLRCHAAQTDPVLLPTTSAGPLNEIRRVLTEAQEFASRLPTAIERKAA